MGQKEGLTMWRDALVASVRHEGPDLSARQMAILLIVYLDERPQTVRGLAGALAISKPAVTRALDRLSKPGYARRVQGGAARRDGAGAVAERSAGYPSPAQPFLCRTHGPRWWSRAPCH